MEYLNTISLIINVLCVLCGLLFAHFLFFAVVGLCKHKSYPEAKKTNRYGMIIPARNEESVISGLIESIKKNDYPQDNIQIFVIAHNCSDNTEAVARNCGATVYRYDNKEETTMGYAFKHLFSCIERDYGIQSFDGFFLFNADNILDRHYIARMNDAFEFFDKKSVITSYRNSKNYGKSLISGLYGMYFSTGCRLESCGRTVMGCSTRVQGTGYLIHSSLVKNGWPYVTLAEDWEFTADQILHGRAINYCDDAIFYDEQPISIPIMWRQRVRWSRGHLIVFVTRIKKLLSHLFSKETKNPFSTYDIITNCLPSTLFFLFLQAIQILLIVTAPLVDSQITWHQIFFGDSMNFLLSTGPLFAWLRSLLLSYLAFLANAIVIFIVDRKRIKHVSLSKKIAIALCWPFFIGIQLPIDVQALFSRNLRWKTIPHTDQTKFEHVNQEEPVVSI
ncbi:MAG: glycosyltransferase family 2 protein [Clostridia bacterium]|nr:glycosyltransferase family 2 protein [Clostridia bacterium]